jgi:hypothetical protein
MGSSILVIFSIAVAMGVISFIVVTGVKALAAAKNRTSEAEPLPEIDEVSELKARIHDLEMALADTARARDAALSKNKALNERVVITKGVAAAAENKIQRWSEILVALLREEYRVKDIFSDEELAAAGLGPVCPSSKEVSA